MSLREPGRLHLMIDAFQRRAQALFSGDLASKMKARLDSLLGKLGADKGDSSSILFGSTIGNDVAISKVHSLPKPS